uniref:Major facilitator superfamily (MFS) profile domain-containing protein n=1 Tax=Arundo donax TaxID=35708 RepID=A0A0A9D048_ARUDO
MIGIGLLVLQQLSGVNGILFYAGSIFKAADITNSNLATFRLGVVQVIATGVTTWLSDKLVDGFFSLLVSSFSSQLLLGMLTPLC